jgi:hypothetical protein
MILVRKLIAGSAMFLGMTILSWILLNMIVYTTPEFREELNNSVISGLPRLLLGVLFSISMIKWGSVRLHELREEEKKERERIEGRSLNRDSS